MNSIRKGFNPRTLLIKYKEGNTVSNTEEVLQGWSEYCEMHFEMQAGTDKDSGEEWAMCVQTAEPYVGPSNDVDIDMAISNLKTVKSSGHDKIRAELMKGRGKNLKQVIYELTLKMWEEEITPHEQKWHNMLN